MRNNQTIWLSFVLAIILCSGSQTPTFASPVFPPSDNQSISQVTASGTAANSNKQTTTEAPKLEIPPSGNQFALAAATIHMLSGLNLDGTKPYKTTILLAEKNEEANAGRVNPLVHVVYKNKADKDYVVTKVFITRTGDKTFDVSAEINKLSSGEAAPTPKVFWLEPKSPAKKTHQPVSSKKQP